MVAKSRAIRDKKSAGPPAGFIQGNEFESVYRVISTGSIMLDAALGIGGFATKQVARLEGKPSVGKSTVAYNVALNAVKMGMIVIWIDSEQSYDKTRALSIGFTEEQLESVYVSKPTKNTGGMYTVNRIASDFDKWIDSGLCDDGFVLIIDSYDMLYSDARVQKADDSSALISDKVKIMTNFVPRLQNALTAYDSLCLVINQARANMDSYSSKFTPIIYAGGWALAHATKQEVELKAVGQVTDSEKEVLGKTIQAKLIKNKYGRNWISVEYDLLENGIDNVDEVIRLSLSFGIIEHPNSKTYIYGDSSFVGMPRLHKFVAIPENYATLKAKVYSLMKDTDTELIKKEEPQDEKEYTDDPGFEEPSELAD